MLEPIRKQSVLKKVRDNGKWFGYIAPNYVNSANVSGIWKIGMAIEIQYDKENNTYLTENSNYEYVALADVLNEFSYYNCNSYLGKRIRFWEEV